MTVEIKYGIIERTFIAFPAKLFPSVLTMSANTMGIPNPTNSE